MSNGAFSNHLRWTYGLTPDDVEPIGTPGYWRVKHACGGYLGGCRSLIHHTVGNAEPMYHTVRYLDAYRDERGRFTSPYRTWREAR